MHMHMLRFGSGCEIAIRDRPDSGSRAIRREADRTRALSVRSRIVEASDGAPDISDIRISVVIVTGVWTCLEHVHVWTWLDMAGHGWTWLDMGRGVSHIRGPRAV